MSTLIPLENYNNEDIPLLTDEVFKEAVELFQSSGYRVKVVREDYLFQYEPREWIALGKRIIPISDSPVYLLVLDRFIENVSY